MLSTLFIIIIIQWQSQGLQIICIFIQKTKNRNFPDLTSSLFNKYIYE